MTLFLTLATHLLLHAEVRQNLNDQGGIAVGNPAFNFDGYGKFKFAPVNADRVKKPDPPAPDTEPR